ncbi:MAG: hypothetical protein ABI718_05020 [Acidobacteriota bacterium]
MDEQKKSSDVDESSQKESPSRDDVTKDLDVDRAEAEEIKGGRARRDSSDPCEGGE